MNTRKCDSAISFKQQVDSIQGQISLVETEESWDIIARAIFSLKCLCEDGANNFPTEIIAAMRGVSRALNNAMNSERTKLSGAAIDLISSLASGLGPAFEPLLHLFFPTLLTLCTRSNKVFITRARACILAIIENTQLPSILTYLAQSLKDKSVSLRLASTEGLLACMNCFNPPDLEKDARAREIEAVIRVTARDASADIRKASRKVFEAYKVLLPNRVDNFTSPLSPTMKKYLDIKSMNQPQQSIRLQKSHSALSDLAKPHLSSSTSALQSSAKSTSDHTLTHARSASSSASLTSRRAEDNVVNPELTCSGTSTGHQPQAPRGPKDMPPPDFIPVRPAKPATRAVSASRTRTNLDERKRTISVSSTALSRSVPTEVRHDPAPASSAQPSCITPSSSTGTVTLGAQRLNAPPAGTSIGPTRPQRPVATLTSGDVRSAAPELVCGGARRIPRPEPVQKEGTRPTSQNDNASSTRTTTTVATTKPDRATKSTTSTKPNVSTKPATDKAKATALPRAVPSATIKASEKAKPIPRPQLVKKLPSHAVTSSTDEGKAVPNTARNVGVRTGGITQPTLSQLSRSKAAVVERKTEGHSAAAKPTWGRPAPAPVPGKVGTTKPLLMKRKDTKKGAEVKPEVIPEAVPLPPSPDRTPIEVPLPNSPPVQESALPHDDLGVGQVHDAAAEEHGSAEDIPATVENGSPTPGNLDSEVTATSRPATPPVISNPSLVLEQYGSPTRTPISALLTSIQRGFLFTPSSPLSPPQSYLHRVAGGEGMSDLTIPFPLQTVVSGEGAFAFGTRKAGV